MAKAQPKISKLVRKLEGDYHLGVTKEYKLKGKAKTDGGGFWSMEVRKVPFTLIIGDDGVDVWGGELSAYAVATFSPKHWNVGKHGLIYTDETWIEGLQKALKKAGIKNYKDIDYTEQGMQGNNYVSLELGRKLTTELVDSGKLKLDLEKLNRLVTEEQGG